MLAITREVSPSINDCELSFHRRQVIDVAKARKQHAAYQGCLAELGARVVSLPADAELPDSVFVEDPAVVLDEIAIIARLGAASRRPEARSLADALAPFRPLEFLREPATLEGGDVLRIGRSIYVGLSQRTNHEGVEQMRRLLAPFDYEVLAVEMRGCLHLKSACSYLGRGTLLLHRACVDLAAAACF